jgi:hypothetical protein
MSALFCACSNDDDDKVNKNYQADDFIQENLAKAKKTFQRQVSNEPQTITLDNGVSLTIPAGNVFTKNGVPITGTYTVEINTMLKPSEVILSGTNTNVAGGYLMSDGFFNIDVLHDGQSVDPVTNDFLSISIPTEKEDGSWTYLWEGNVNDDEQFAWGEVADTLLAERPDVDKGGVLSYNKSFTFQFKKLGWFNCDVYWSGGTTSTTVTVVLSGQVGALATYQGNTGDTFVFFKAKESNVIAQLYTEVNATTVKSYDNSMPVGTEGTLLAFSIKDGAYSFAIKEITITADMQEALDLQPVTKEAVLAALVSLDQ